jgi:D-3-phosphoglycerate dehydrogenase
LRIIDRFDGVIAGDDPFTAQVLAKGKKLKTVAKWGIGLDAIALDAAKNLGITVTNTPDVFADEVADVVMGYLIMLTRGLHLMDQSVRQGGWLKIQGRSLKGKTLGVIGVGSIGSAVVDRGKAMGMSLVGYDVKPIPYELIDKTGIKKLDLEELLKVADVISLNCNLNQNNYHLLSN